MRGYRLVVMGLNVGTSVGAIGLDGWILAVLACTRSNRTKTFGQDKLVAATEAQGSPAYREASQ